MLQRLTFTLKDTFYGSRLTRMLSMDDVKRAVWCTSILQHLGEQHCTGGHTLGGLQQEGVAAHHSHWEHPQRDHGREVKGGNACTHAQRQPVCVGIHVFGDGGQRFTHHQGGDTAGMLDDLWGKKGKAEFNVHFKGNCLLRLYYSLTIVAAAKQTSTRQTFTNDLTSSACTPGGDKLTQSSKDVALCIRKSLSLLVRDALGQFFLEQDSKNEFFVLLMLTLRVRVCVCV